jgi:endonuclease/exonuclease/phosphatase family metal-dependent hydrolase
MEGIRGFFTLVVAALFGIGAFFFFQHFQIKGLENLLPKSGDAAKAGDSPLAGGPGGTTPVALKSETIRIASFNIQVFGQAKLAKPHVMQRLAQIVRKFDVVAIQEVRAKDDNVLPAFLSLINADGRQYDYVIGPRLGRTPSKEQYAFVFDKQTIEIDRSQLYTVQDPDDLLHREPLVAWFRARGPPPEAAFTFTLVNIHTDPDEVPQEVAALASVFRAVRDDGRGEDDVIVLGDLNASDRQLGPLGQISGVTVAISGEMTNTRRTSQYDNLVFAGGATREYVGRGGVFDMLREFNLTTEAALEISDHLPVWGEFSVYEGGRPGAVAALPESVK